ncbi:MAG: hypothetical protein KC421_28275, partial [Anaerolineales bacterium]|nr:hypothetical protein [Anaerolineales bacterium]
MPISKVTDLTQDKQSLLRELPSVDRLLQQADATALIEEYGRYLTVEAVR